MNAFDALPAGDRSMIQNFLASVESDMRRTGAPASKIAAVRDALSEQIDDARAEAGDGADLEHILKSIDPPYSFADGDGGSPSAAPDDASLIGKLSLGFAILGVAAAVLSQLGGAEFADRVGGPAFVFSELLAICLGILARQTTMGRAGLVCGGACLTLILVVIALGG